MKMFTRFLALPISFLFGMGSCTVQDHLTPAANPYEKCQLTRITNNIIIPIPPNSDLKVGDLHPGQPGMGAIYGKVVDIIDIDGQKYALAAEGNGYNNYVYDSEGRIIKYEADYRFQKGVPTYRYEYAPGKVTEKYQDVGLTPVTATTYTLNEYGLIPKKNTTYDQQGYETENRVLDNDGYGRIVKYTILNGNTIKTETDILETGRIEKETSIHEFDLTKPNLPNPFPFKRKENSNLLLRSATNRVHLSGPITYPYTVMEENRYTFDGDGKVVRKITISTNDSGNKWVSAEVYTYTCKE